MQVSVSFPVVIAKEGKWFVASCPILNIATQGGTEEEVKENMHDLISEYFKDPDTPKPRIKAMQSVSVSLTNIPVKLPRGVYHRETSATVKT